MRTSNYVKIPKQVDSALGFNYYRDFIALQNNWLMTFAASPSKECLGDRLVAHSCELL